MTIGSCDVVKCWCDRLLTLSIYHVVLSILRLFAYLLSRCVSIKNDPDKCFNLPCFIVYLLTLVVQRLFDDQFFDATKSKTHINTQKIRRNRFKLCVHWRSESRNNFCDFRKWCFQLTIWQHVDIPLYRSTSSRLTNTASFHWVLTKPTFPQRLRSGP